MTVTINNPWYEVFNDLEHIIRTYVTDINTVRKALSSPANQWIFPSIPENTANYFPIVAIILNNISYSEYGAGRHISTGVVGTGVDDTKGRIITMNLTIGIFSKRNEEFTITMQGKSSTQIAKNNLVNAYLTTEIAKKIEINRDYLFGIDSNYEDITINSITPTYEDDRNIFISEINMEVQMKDIWGTTYDANELIAIINQTLTASYT